MIRPKWTYRIVKGQEGTITPNESEKITAPRNTTRVAEVPKQRIKVDPIDIPMGDWEWPESGNTIADPNNDQYVSEFFEYDVLPRYMREHPNATKEEIEAVKKAYSYPQYMSDLKNGTGGWTVHGDGETHIDYNKNYKLSRPVMVHENTHAYRLNGASYTPEEKELLLNAYDVSGSTEYPIDESGATNSEVRYRLWKELYDNLGRRPSLEELDAYIQNYDKYKLIDGVEGANDYGRQAIRNLQHKRYPEDDPDFVGPRREDAGSNMPDEYFWNGYRMLDENVNNIRNALIHVADNNVEEPQIEGNQLARWGGVIKGQHGILTPWYKAYNSKFGQGIRNLMFGKDYDLSDEEYVQKYGYAKPITGTGMLPGKTSMNAFESIEGPLVKGSFGTGAKYNAGQQIMKTNAISKTVQPKTASNWDKFLKKSLDEQNKIVKYWDERYSTMRQLQANQKQFRRFVKWINKQ